MAAANQFRNYLPAEDSRLLQRCISSLTGEAALEIGAASGSNLLDLIGGFEQVVGTDLFAELRGDARIDFVRADAASCFRADAFDLVLFNPPYLPSQGVSDPAVDGGEGGVEVPLRLLGDAIRVLKVGGRVLLVLSSHSDIITLFDYCNARDLSVENIAEEPLFFERLYVFRVSRKESRARA